MSHLSRPLWPILLCSGIAACGGGGAGGSGSGSGSPTAAPATTASFRSLSTPGGFPLETASLKSTKVTADTLLSGGSMPPGYADPQVYTWVNFSYVDSGGVAHTLALVRWQVLANLGAQGLRLELPSAASSLHFDVYNSNGSTSGNVSI